MRKEEINKLRQEARKILAQRSQGIDQSQWNKDAEKLLEELSVYQVELEMQNEELKNSQAKLEEEKNRYQELYNQAPVAYITLTAIGNIVELNQTAASLFGKRKELFKFNSVFPFIEEHSKNDFRKLLQEAMKQNTQTDGEISFVSPERGLFLAKLQMIPYFDTRHQQPLCRITLTDIAKERENFDNQLFNKEQKYRELTENISEGIYMAENGAFTSVNFAFAKMFGYHPKELFGMPTWLLAAPEIRQQTKELFFAKAKNKDTSPEEVKCQRKDGTLFWAEIRISNYKSGGKIFGIVSDISRRKQAEKAQEETRTLFEQMFSHMKSGVAIYKAINKGNDFVFVNFNRAAEKITNSKKREVIGKSLLSKFPNMDKTALFKTLQEVYKTGKDKHIPPFYYKDRWREGWRENYIYKLPSGEIVAIFDDVTDRENAKIALQESEQRYKNLFHNNKSAMLLIEPETGKIVDANHAACQYYGYPHDQIAKLHITDINIMSPEAIENEMKKAKSGDRNHFIFRHKLADGKIRHVEVYSGKIQLAQKQLLYSTIYDVEDRIQAEKALKESEARLRELNITKDKFFSIVAHDLKSPLSSMLGFVELLKKNQKTYTPEKREQFIQLIAKSSKLIYALLENLLMWARSQTGKIAFNPEAVKIGKFMNETLTLLQHTASSKQIKIETKIQKPETEIFIDRQMISTVLRNLISNAIKFTPPQGTITIGAKEKDPQHTMLFFVRDSGVGIPPKNQKKLFKIDHSFSTRGTKNEKGTGLGLILSKEFVEKSGGKIWFESQQGKGTTFFFTIANIKRTKHCQYECLQNLSEIKAQIQSNPILLKEFKKQIIPLFLNTYKKPEQKNFELFTKNIEKINGHFQIKALDNFNAVIRQSFKKSDTDQINICFSEFEELIIELEK